MDLHLAAPIPPWFREVVVPVALPREDCVTRDQVAEDFEVMS